MKDICSYITDNVSKEKHIISANEGGAVALAIGYHLATGKIPLVYMQNSGFGNTINPLLSLADPKVYGIPMLLVIGWRGEPGQRDEPQHIKQGQISESLLETLEIPYIIISEKTKNINKLIFDSVSQAKKNNEPFAILVRKGTFESYSLKTKIKTNFKLEISNLINNFN